MYFIRKVPTCDSRDRPRHIRADSHTDLGTLICCSPYSAVRTRTAGQNNNGVMEVCWHHEEQCSVGASTFMHGSGAPCCKHVLLHFVLWHRGMQLIAYTARWMLRHGRRIDENLSYAIKHGEEGTESRFWCLRASSCTLSYYCTASQLQAYCTAAPSCTGSSHLTETVN